MGNNSFKNGVKKLCESLGRSNKATYAVVAIAVAKGIFRPIFTMADKHENPKTKKYTAVREGLTEVVAIPTYLGVAKIAEKVATNLKISGKENVEIAKHNANFLGVCLAAAIVIPVITSIIINPMMKLFMKDEKANDYITKDSPRFLDLKGENVPKKSIEVSDNSPKQISPYALYRQPLDRSFAPVRQLGMKVGGL